MVIAAAIAALTMFSSAQPAPCARPKGDVRAQASLELAQKVGARDTIAVVRVCLATKDPAQRIGSYHGLLTWDATAARLDRVDKGRMGMRIENTNKPGAVDFAGAFPAGLNDTIALTVRLALAKPGKVPKLTLHMHELNTVDGNVLTSQLRVTGYPSSVRTKPGPLRRDTTASVAVTPVRADSVSRPGGGGTGGGSGKAQVSTAPTITSVTQTSGGAGDPVQAVIKGTGFTPTGNTVMFDRVEIGNLSSADGGTMIRFTVPGEMPSSSEVPPMKIGGGVYDVIVKNSRGTSNAFRFQLKVQL